MQDSTKAKWTQVTTVSKWMSIVFFLGILPPAAFYIGMQYQAIVDQALRSQQTYLDLRVICSKMQAQAEEAAKLKEAQASSTAAPAR